MKKPKKNFLLFLLFVAPVIFGSSYEGNSQNLQYINEKFFNNLESNSAVLRDDFFTSKLNNIIQCRAIVKNIKLDRRYNRNYKITLEDSLNNVKNIKITYFVYIENNSTYKMIEKESLFEFSGQLMSYTPVNTQRTHYLLDVVLEKGAIVIE